MSATLSIVKWDTVRQVEREARRRFPVSIAGPVDNDSTPQFAFTAYDARPTEWHSGEWATEGIYTVALTSIVGQTPDLAIGLYLVWIRLYLDGQMYVERVGTLRVR